MLKIGLTGGIASGKSLVASTLKELGAVLIDADVIAREVVEPGTPGLARVVEAFGPGVLDVGGRLDRPALGAIVFKEPARREVLNGIIHPLVRERAAAMLSAAASGDVVVQDIPLLVETGQGSSFHLVLVVDAPDAVRVRRMVEYRGMTPDEAASRMAAQSTRAERLAAADVVLDNSGGVEEIRARVQELWEQRLLPFARNLAASRTAPGSGGPLIVPADPDWPAQAGRLIERLGKVSPEMLGVEHIGSTSVPGLDAKDVIDLQVAVSSLAVADRMAGELAGAGFPVKAGIVRDTPKPPDADPSAWQKRFHSNADPGRAANVHVRVQGSPGWRYALLLRDWLRANPEAAALYAAEKHRLAALHAGDGGTLGYAEAKEPWFTEVAWPEMESWARQSGWQPKRGQ
ncbi:dephospho-CoA kinase [Arthrobacter cavernae]|uniref:Dephospho-CoA kinase n=1 Tax=Arthrobacter cavernae TaxID=2817681 RepID=A0A939HL92_9MICC|nr:dephospho-CoA kinase [Arthrobacter cavernae]MBO1269420.1 dephospho-CoA kinase [Arthrobacter cavernae]